MNNIYVLINQIKEHTSMFLKHPYNIRDLQALLFGYITCQKFHNIIELNVPPFTDFPEWLSTKKKSMYMSKGWADAILRENDNNLEKALHSFFDFVDEFLFEFD